MARARQSVDDVEAKKATASNDDDRTKSRFRVRAHRFGLECLVDNSLNDGATFRRGACEAVGVEAFKTVFDTSTSPSHPGLTSE